MAAHVGEDFWSVELRLPVTSSDEDPLHQMIGSRPFQAKQERSIRVRGPACPGISISIANGPAPRTLKRRPSHRSVRMRSRSTCR